jgi:hypothetical protein
MSRLFLNPRGRSTYGLGICDRCSRKFSLEDLYPDPNIPGLRVCKDDMDQLDPWRLPFQAESIALAFHRPDLPLDPNGPATYTVPFVPAPDPDYPDAPPPVTPPPDPGSYAPGTADFSTPEGSSLIPVIGL